MGREVYKPLDLKLKGKPSPVLRRPWIGSIKMSEDTMTPEEIPELSSGRRRFLPDPRVRLVHFVNLLKKAHQLYNLKEYLREECNFITHDGDAYHILKRLVCDPKLKDRFNTVDAAVMLSAIREHIQELKIQQVQKLYPMQLGKSSRNDVLKFMIFGPKDSSQFSVEQRPLLEASLDEELNETPPRDPIYELVRQAREEGHIMDANPQVELDKIEKSCPLFYMENFNAFTSKLKYPENIVQFFCLTDVDTAQDLKTLLSEYGEIVNMNMFNTVNDKSKSATVTFKYPEAARIAPFIRPKISHYIQLKSDRPPMSYEDVSNEVSKAKAKYEKLCSYYLRLFSAKDDKRCSVATNAIGSSVQTKRYPQKFSTKGGNVCSRCSEATDAIARSGQSGPPMKFLNRGRLPPHLCLEKNPLRKENICSVCRMEPVRTKSTKSTKSFGLQA